MFTVGDLVAVKATTQIVRSRIADLVENKWRVVIAERKSTFHSVGRDIKEGDTMVAIESVGVSRSLKEKDWRWIATRNLTQFQEKEK